MDRDDWRNASDPRRAAAGWHAELGAETLPENDHAAFADWLRKSPTHLEEYLRLAALRHAMSDPQVFEGISLQALQTQIGSNVQDLASAVPIGDVTVAGGTDKSRGWRKTFAIAASLLLLGTLGGLAWRAAWLRGLPVAGNTPTYQTAIGEQRSVVLPDGSIAELNTRSTLSLRFGVSARDAVLTDGEALFRVVRDSRRPFRVYSGGAVVQVIGTEFTVRCDPDRTTVTVLEGRVRVESAASQTTWGGAKNKHDTVLRTRIAPVELVAGQRLALSPKDMNDPVVDHVDAASALAWKSRRLVFDDLPLRAVAAEFNRYNKPQIQVEGPILGTRSITGVFNANDPESFLRFLEGTGTVVVSRAASGDSVVRSRVAP